MRTRINGSMKGVRFDGRVYSPGAEYYRAVRQKIIHVLGGKCVRCGFSDWRALQVDHVSGSSRERRISQTYYLYLDILMSIKNGTRKYQLLCSNCNWIKKYENDENPRRSPVDLSNGSGVSFSDTKTKGA